MLTINVFIVSKRMQLDLHCICLKSQPNTTTVSSSKFLIHFNSSLFFPSEVLCKWCLLQAGRPSVPDDRRRRPCQSGLDAVWHLAHLCQETGSSVFDAGTPILWEKSPNSVCLVLLWRWAFSCAWHWQGWKTANSCKSDESQWVDIWVDLATVNR